MDPLGEILKALTSTTMNAWGCLAILFVCGAWAYGQYLRHVYHKEERAARVPGDSGQAMPPVPPVKPPGTNGLLLILLAMFGLGLGGIILRSGFVLERSGGVAGAPPGCSPATCKPPSRCTADGCADVAAPHGEVTGDPPWASDRGAWDGRAPWLKGGS